MADLSVTPADTNALMMMGRKPELAEAAARLKHAGKEGDTKKIDEAAQDFEAMFVSEMVKPMFEGLDPDPMFGGGKGEEIFKDMLIQEYGKKIAAAGGIGIAEHVKAEMIRMQEEARK